MENKGLLFIPDISGFTKFVSTMELDHSRLIIQELLEILVKANRIGLEISEIEGDAILFYKYGNSPDLEALYSQVQEMFRAFHNHLLAYEARRFCQCHACSGAIDLSLKVITHYGEFTNYQVQQFRKLIGKDVIVAHQLLKNDIPQHEYWLITKNLADAPPESLIKGITWNNSVKQTENGEIPFYYAMLSDLKNELSPTPPPPLDLSNKVKVWSLSAEIESNIIVLFHATGDFQYRSRWLEGVKTVEEVNHFLARIGMRCRYVFEHGQKEIYISSYSFDPARIAFSETEEKTNNTMTYLLEKLDDHLVRLTLDYYVPRNMVNQLFFSLFQKKKIQAQYEKSFQHLQNLVRDIKLPD